MTPELFERLFEVLPTPYMVLDRHLRYVAANRAYVEAIGRDRAALLGNGFFDLFPGQGDNGTRLRASFDVVLQTREADTIAFLPYAIQLPPEAGGGIDQRYWTTTHTPVLDAAGETEFIIQNAVDVTDIVRVKEQNAFPMSIAPGELALLRHAQEVEEALHETASESAEFRRLFRQAPGMIAVVEGPDHVFSFVNDSFQRFIGGRDVVGKPMAEALPELDGQGYLELIDTVFNEGSSFQREGVRLKVVGERGDAPQEVFIDFATNPIRDADGRVTGVFIQSADRTEFMRAVERQRHLIDELNHRVKNTLSTVQSMARQSFRNLQDAEDARYAFEARIMALSQAHNVLSARRWEYAGLSVLLEQELSTFDDRRVVIQGREVNLTAKSAIALAMVFHELSSNARNYGAFSTEDGTLLVNWGVVDRGGRHNLQLTWTEKTGKPLGGKLEDGFGTRMLRRIVEGEFDGDILFDLKPSGFLCRMEVPLPEIQAVSSTAA